MNKMITIVWDDTLPPTLIDTEIQRWDRWFDTVGMTKEWAVVKSQFPDDVDRQLMWANIIELNRISAATEKAKQTT